MNKQIILFLLLLFIFFTNSCDNKHVVYASHQTEFNICDTIEYGNIELYSWGVDGGMNMDSLIAIFGKPNNYERVDFEHCFDGDDTIFAFYNTYIFHPEYSYALVSWGNIDSIGSNLTLYMRRLDLNEYNDRIKGGRKAIAGGYYAFWGYRCRPEDFTTDIYKVE